MLQFDLKPLPSVRVVRQSQMTFISLFHVEWTNASIFIKPIDSGLVSSCQRNILKPKEAKHEVGHKTLTKHRHLTHCSYNLWYVHFSLHPHVSPLKQLHPLISYIHACKLWILLRPNDVDGKSHLFFQPLNAEHRMSNSKCLMLNRISEKCLWCFWLWILNIWHFTILSLLFIHINT